MRVEEEVEIHEIVQSVTGDHLGPDGWKGRLRVSAPLLGGKVPRRRHVPDRGIQVLLPTKRQLYGTNPPSFENASIFIRSSNLLKAAVKKEDKILLSLVRPRRPLL